MRVQVLYFLTQHLMLIFSILIHVFWYFHMILVCIFLMTNDVYHLFLCLFATHVSLLGKYLFKYFPHFFTSLFCFLIIEMVFCFKCFSWNNHKQHFEELYKDIVAPNYLRVICQFDSLSSTTILVCISKKWGIFHINTIQPPIQKINSYMLLLFNGQILVKFCQLFQ